MSAIPPWLQQWKAAADATASSATALGLVIGAVWTYLLFIRRRQKYPRANIEHRVWHWQAGNTTVIHLAVRVTNVGEVIIRQESVSVKVQQLLPVHPTVMSVMESPGDPLPSNESEIDWPEIASRECDWAAACREVEPGETDECLFDFVLPREITKVALYSYLRNHTKRGRNIGWSATTIYSLSDQEKSHGDEKTRAATHDGARSTKEAVPPTPTEALGVEGQVEVV